MSLGGENMKGGQKEIIRKRGKKFGICKLKGVKCIPKDQKPTKVGEGFYIQGRGGGGENVIFGGGWVGELDRNIETCI
jgi:hypothetical protein